LLVCLPQSPTFGKDFQTKNTSPFALRRVSYDRRRRSLSRRASKKACEVDEATRNGLRTIISLSRLASQRRAGRRSTNRQRLRSLTEETKYYRPDRYLHLFPTPPKKGFSGFYNFSNEANKQKLVKKYSSAKRVNRELREIG